MRTISVVSLLLIAFSGMAIAQRPRADAPGTIAVTFKIGDKEVTCGSFRLRAKIGERVLISGKFRSRFQVPVGASQLPRNDALEVELRCGKERWHFVNVPETALRPGNWEVGTDYPPFGERFRHSPNFQDTAWVKYLSVDEPDMDPGFYVFFKCPIKDKDLKHGPCYNN